MPFLVWISVRGLRDCRRTFGISEKVVSNITWVAISPVTMSPDIIMYPIENSAVNYASMRVDVTLSRRTIRRACVFWKTFQRHLLDGRRSPTASAVSSRGNFDFQFLLTCFIIICLYCCMWRNTWTISSYSWGQICCYYVLTQIYQPAEVNFFWIFF